MNHFRKKKWEDKDEVFIDARDVKPPTFFWNSINGRFKARFIETQNNSFVILSALVFANLKWILMILCYQWRKKCTEKYKINSQCDFCCLFTIALIIVINSSCAFSDSFFSLFFLSLIFRQHDSNRMRVFLIYKNCTIKSTQCMLPIWQTVEFVIREMYNFRVTSLVMKWLFTRANYRFFIFQSVGFCAWSFCENQRTANVRPNFN